MTDEQNKSRLYKPWYTEPESELREKAQDPEFRAVIEHRISELKLLNQYGLRCTMSKAMCEKLERVLA